MNQKKELLLIENLLSNKDLFTKCYSILEYDYFKPEHKHLVKFILNYYEEYKALPSTNILNAETDIELNLHDITRDQIEYSAKEIEKFCQNAAMMKAVEKMVEEITNGNLDGIYEIGKEASLVSLDTDLGQDYVEDVEERMERLTKEQQHQSTGLYNLDELMGGGLLRKQLVVFSANAGSGKSITLNNLAINLLEAKLDVLYVSLELDEDLIGLRTDGLITNSSSDDVKASPEKTIKTVMKKGDIMGKFTIKYMPSGTNSKAIEAYLKEYELRYNKLPDVLIVDYLDIMGQNNSKSGEGIFEKDKNTSEELRNIGSEYNMYVLTASQQNRSGINVLDIDQTHIAGGISKINTADFWFSVLLNDELRQEGTIIYKCIKSRTSDGVGKNAYQSWNHNSLRIGNQKTNDGSNNDGIKSSLKTLKKNDKKINENDPDDVENKLDSSLLDIMNMP